MLIDYHLGQTSIVLRVKIRNSSVSTGAGLTGLTNASSGLIISTITDNESTATTYTVAGSTIDTIATLGTYAAPTAGHCRFKQVDSVNHPGIYELQIADARFAVASAKSVLISISGATNAAECDVVVPLRSVDPYDAVRMGLSALPNVASGSAGSLLTSGTGTSQLNVSGGKAPATLDSTDVTGNLACDLQTIKTQTVTCSSAVTVEPFVGNATHAIAVDTNGAVTFNNTSIATVTDLTNAPPDSSGVTTLLSRIPSTLFSGITSLAHWLGLLAGKQVGDTTARTELRATGAGSGTFDETTDSQEALRDRGDAAWATATGFSTFNPSSEGVTLADGVTHGGSTAQLQLAQIQVVNSAGDAVVFDSTGGNGTGLKVIGGGTGHGLEAIAAGTGKDFKAGGGGEIDGTLATATSVTNGVALAASQPNYAPAKAGDAMTLTSAYDAAKTAAQAGDAMTLTAAGLDAVLIESGIAAGVTLVNDSGTQLTSINGRQLLALAGSALAGILSGAATDTIDAKPAGKGSASSRITATVDADGNRTALTLRVPD